MGRGAWWATVHGVTKESDNSSKCSQGTVYSCGFDLNNTLSVLCNWLFTSYLLPKDIICSREGPIQFWISWDSHMALLLVVTQ